MASETPADISMMVTLMAERIERMTFGATAQDVWRTAGRILCPIFDYAKPASYIAAMTEVRLQYAGISGDSELQGEFAEALDDLASAGALDSLESAVRTEAWRLLRRRSAAGF